MRYAEFNMQNDTVVVDSGPDPTTVAKIAAMFTLGISSFVLGVLPIKLASMLKWDLPSCGNRNGSQNSLAVHLLLSFGGGVLLYTCLMHLQPEVREGMEHVIKMGLVPESVVDSGIHWSEFIFCMGFFLVYFIEEIVHTCLDKSKNEDDMQALHRTISIRKKCRAAGNLIPRIHLSKPNQSPPSTITASTQVLIRDGHYKSNTIDPMENMVPPISQFAPSIVSDDSGRIEPVRKRSVVKSFRGFIAVVALSFHAIFEGLAVGLEKNAANVWYLCAAIATHKLVIAFCVGVELVSTRTKTALIIIYMATFAIVSPLGIGIGLGLTFDNTNSPEMALVSIILQGLASGTLLYVVFFEVLQREKSGRHGMIQLLSILSGFAVMILLSLFIGHHVHDHGHDHVDHDRDHHHHPSEIVHHEHT